MTHDQLCKRLLAYPREAVVLPLVAHLAAEQIVLHCEGDYRLACEWALDSARRVALREADSEEALAAASAADRVHGLTFHTRHALDRASGAALYAAGEGHVSSVAFGAASASGLRTIVARQAFANSLREAPREWSTAQVLDGYVVTPDSVWLREGHWGGRWIRRDRLTAEELVALDALLEASAAEPAQATINNRLLSERLTEAEYLLKRAKAHRYPWFVEHARLRIRNLKRR
jgi:hypothetical protein